MVLPADGGGTGSGGRIQVHPLDFANLGVTLESGSYDVNDAWAQGGANDAWAGGFGANGWAGGDQAAVTFSQAYDDLGAVAAVNAFNTVQQVTYAFGAALAQMALNYLTAEQRSTISTGLGESVNTGMPPDPHLSGLAERIWNVEKNGLIPVPPNPVQDIQAPGTALDPPASQADTATARQVATVWHAMASNLATYFGSWDARVRAVAADNNGLDVTAVRQSWQALYRPGDAGTLLEGTRQLCAALGDFCDSYAGIADQEHDALVTLAAEVARVFRGHMIGDEYAAAVQQVRQQAAAAVAGSPQLAQVQALTGEVTAAVNDNSGTIQAVAARTTAVPAPPAA